MKRSLVKIAGCITASLLATSVWGAGYGDSSSSSTSSTDSTDSLSDSSKAEGSGMQSESQDQLSPTGRSTSASKQVRASKLIGADVSGQQGDRIGTIEDVILNSANGRAEFAVISLSGAPATGAAPSPATGMAGDKLYPVPWRLLKPSSSGAAATGTTAITGARAGEVSFTLNTERSKVQQGPSFDRTNWPDISTSDWRQRIFSHFGVSQSGMGGAEDPSSAIESGSESSPGSDSPSFDSPSIPSSPPSSQSNP